jgi:hypothetical protein
VRCSLRNQTRGILRGTAEDAALNLAKNIEITVASLGLPSRTTFFDFESNRIDEVGELLRRNYPDEVSDLGEDADLKLDRLLENRHGGLVSGRGCVSSLRRMLSDLADGHTTSRRLINEALVKTEECNAERNVFRS